MHGGNYRTPSLVVGWLCIALGVSVSIYYTYELLTSQNELEKIESYVVRGESYVNPEIDDFFTTNLKGVIKESLIYIPLAIFLLFVPSILLVIGISHNRPKLVAAWIYANCLSVVLITLFVIYMCWITIESIGNLAAGLYSGLTISGGMVFTLLCICPVRKYNKIMSNPRPVLPTHCYMNAKKTIGSASPYSSV